MRRHGFSLVELLLAVFILGIGVIAVAALFPAGIAQQRQSVDDTLGPQVANNALALIRTRVRPEMFGTALVLPNPGDWPWRRPKFVFPDGPTGQFPFGAIDVFGATTQPGASEGIPWAGSGPPPLAVITQLERSYPMRSENSIQQHPGQPQYVWECMFRRFQGRVQVAIFVYRVSLPAGSAFPYVVPRNPSNPTVPPLPISIALADPWDADGNLAQAGIQPSLIIPGTNAGTAFDPADHAQSWQAPGQWLLDQNNNVHRVLAGRRRPTDGPVELMRPIATLPNVAAYDIDRTVPPFDVGVVNVVGNIWCIPAAEIDIDSDLDGTTDLPVSLSPVYVTVRDL